MPSTTKPNRAACGRIVMTRAVADSIDFQLVKTALSRHFNGDWGTLSEDDAALNTQTISTQDGGRLMSSYHDLGDQPLWVITDGYGNDPTDPDLCHTTVLLPSDY